MPSENPNLTERGLIITDFVDRVGDPVGIVAADGSTHLADKVRSPTRCGRCCTRSAAAGRPPDPSRCTYPRTGDPPPSTRCATPWLRCRSSNKPTPAPLVSDATAALTALQDDPGVPTSGVIALCDFGGTGTSITLVDAANGFAPIGPTVRHTDLSGDLIDQALLTHVINDLSGGGHHRLVRHLGDRLADAGCGPSAAEPRSGCPPPPSPHWWPSCPGIAATCG